MENIKKFEDFLDRMQGLLDNAKRQGHIIVRVEDLENTFPELKEPEDERIRKAVIEYFRWNTKQILNEFSNKKALAWLEKQGKHANFRNKIQIGDKVTRNDNGELVNLSQLERVAKKLEKQEEQKPVEEYNITGIGSKNAQGKLGEMVKNLKPVNEILEQKSADKVEPKFNVGDWVVTSYGMVNQVIAVDEDGDGFALDDDTYLSGSWKDNFHLWTIQDAKDGDVLYSPSHCLIWIYKDNEHYHACVNMNYVIENVATDGLISIPNDACPATKDEQTILFARMKETGYEWDAEKKELKKIEHKHFCELDNSYTCVKFPFKAKVKSSDTIVTIHGGQLSLGGKEWIKYQSDAEDGYKVYEPNNLELVCEIEQNPAWSEEDEAHLDSILKRLEGMCKPGATYTATRCSISEDKDWLKSLKEKFVKFDKGFNVGFSAAKHNQWKPSDEQMAALSDLNRTGEIYYVGQGQELINLYNDLKKLREE